MTKNKIGLRTAPAALAAGAVLLIAAVPAPGQNPAPPTGSLDVTVVLADGGSPPSSTLYLKDRAVDLGADETTYRFEGVAPGTYALTGDSPARGESSAEGKRYVGVQKVGVAADGNSIVTLTLEEVEDIEAFCRRCHPDAGTSTDITLIERDLHTSGAALGEEFLVEVEKYNARAARLQKEGQPHNLPIVLEKREGVEKGRKVTKSFFTCESCHTLHYQQEESSFTRAPFRKKADLCLGCHS